MSPHQEESEGDEEHGVEGHTVVQQEHVQDGEVRVQAEGMIPGATKVQVPNGHERDSTHVNGVVSLPDERASIVLQECGNGPDSAHLADDDKACQPARRGQDSQGHHCKEKNGEGSISHGCVAQPVEVRVRARAVDTEQGVGVGRQACLAVAVHYPATTSHRDSSRWMGCSRWIG